MPGTHEPRGRPYVGRLAPSPTGALHVGNVRTFLVAWLRARQEDGRLLLRIEDLDHPKVKRGASRALLEDLRWLGLDWDEGPERGGPHAPYVQSRRSAHYRRALGRLAAGGHLYACSCTRRDVTSSASAPHGLDGPLYPGTCRDRFPGWHAAQLAARPRAAAIRFRVPPQAHVRVRDRFAPPLDAPAHRIGDFVVARHGASHAYQLAVVVDDLAMGVTEVVRGDDLLPSTPRQILLYRALGHEPPAFVHLPLVVGPDGRRLAKRHGDTRIAAIRAAGARPAALLGWLARSLGIDVDAVEHPEALLAAFRLDAVPPEPCVLEPERFAREIGIAPAALGA
ncbi:MAG: tRNA glutamyl-Q(34) synthetase GluQRS [Planctomycetota bacterium]|nr:MAG: tRNA glutamyl-Q(34) synthetase GluQRS [Planctomycetota bacterium]